MRHREPALGAALTAVLAVMVVVLAVLPRIGRTPETLTDLAKDLLENDQPAAAAALCDEAEDKITAGDMDLLAELRRIRFESLALLADRALDDGRTAEADNLVRRLSNCALALEDEEQRVREMRFDWLSARVEAARTDRLSFRGSFRRLLANARLEAIGRTGNQADVADAVLDLITRSLAWNPAGRRATAWGLLELETAIRPGTAVAEWFQEDLARRKLLLEEMVRVASETADQQARQTWDNDVSSVLVIFSGLRARGHQARLASLLAALARGGGRSDEERALAAHLLAVIEDLPQKPSTRPYRRYPGWDETTTRETLTLHDAVREVPQARSLHLRIEAAVEQGNRDWLTSHLGGEWGNAEACRAWWAEHREQDLVALLARRAGLPAGLDATDMRALLEQLRRATNDRQRLIHHLLVLAAPDHVACPTPGPDNFVRAWREALGKKPVQTPYRFRVSLIRLQDAEPPEIIASHRRAIRIGEPETFALERHEPRRWDGAFGMPGLGALADAPRRATTSSRGGYDLDWRDGALRLGPVRVGTVLVQGSMDGYGGERGGSVSTHITVMLAEEAAHGEDRPYSLDDWRRVLASNLAEIMRELRESGPGPEFGQHPVVAARQHSIWSLPRLAAWLGLPGQEKLFADCPIRPGDTMEGPDVVRARLAAGDATVLADPSCSDQLARLKESFHKPHHLGWWGRLLMTTEDSRIRTLAAEVLLEHHIPPRVAAAIDRAIDAGEIEVPSALVARVKNAPRRVWLDELNAYVGWLGAVVFLWVVAIIYGVSVLWPGTRTARKGTAAVGFLVLGLGMTAVDIWRFDVDLLPDTVGLVLAAAGIAVLVRVVGARTAAPRLAIAALLAAAVAAALSGWGVARGASGILADALVAFVLVILPALVRSVEAAPGVPADVSAGGMPRWSGARAGARRAIGRRPAPSKLPGLVVPLVLCGFLVLTGLTREPLLLRGAFAVLIAFVLYGLAKRHLRWQAERAESGKPTFGMPSLVLYAWLVWTPALLWTLGSVVALVSDSDPRERLDPVWGAVFGVLLVLSFLRMGYALGLAARRRRDLPV